MSKQAHTPGPWKVVTAIETRMVASCGRLIIQSAPCHADEFGSTQDDANLIACAPELLDALKKAYQQCIEFLNEGDFRRNVEWDAGYIVDAIAKAEGRKS